MKFSLTFLAVFVGAALADSHYSCTCHNGDSYNWRITSPACDSYASSQPASVSYISSSGRCTSDADTGDQLDGDAWEAACKKIATEGFACADGQGTCYASADEIKGWCD